MKKTISYAALALILAGSFVTSCESNVQKVENAQENLIDAKVELKDLQIALNEEYPAFKLEAEAKIEANEKRIELLNLVIIEPNDKKLEDLRKRRIEELNQKTSFSAINSAITKMKDQIGKISSANSIMIWMG